MYFLFLRPFFFFFHPFPSFCGFQKAYPTPLLFILSLKRVPAA